MEQFRRRYSGRIQTEDAGAQSGNWILLVLFYFGPLCMIQALNIYFHVCLGVKYQNTTAERQVLQSTLESLNDQITEERAKLKQRLQEIDNYASEGWLYFQGSVYLGSTTKQTWQESRQYCQQRGADLTIISSVQEQEFVSSQFPNNRWIGLSDLEQKGVWKWLDGSLLNTRFWSGGEPNEGIRIETCVEIMYRDTLFNWNDLRCDRKRDFICEKRIFTDIK